jgi:hypothetical protein
LLLTGVCTEAPGREQVYIEIGGARIHAESEPGRSTTEKTSTVDYACFPFPLAAREALRRGDPARIVIDHPHYRAEATLTPDVQRSLAADFD